MRGAGSADAARAALSQALRDKKGRVVLTGCPRGLLARYFIKNSK